MTIWRDRAALALDMTHEAAFKLIGIHTDTMRARVAMWLDCPKAVKFKDARRAILYLESIPRHG